MDPLNSAKLQIYKQITITDQVNTYNINLILKNRCLLKIFPLNTSIFTNSKFLS